jgi:predicted amidohydrolase YtcJ
MEATPDLILLHGKVHTLDPNGGTATGVAIREGRIHTVGSDREMESLAGPETERLDLAGAVVVPGLIDSHCHIVSVGHTVDAVLLYDAWSIDEIIDRLREWGERHPGPILGRGGNFHETSLAEGRLPTAEDLDKVSAERPVMITDVNKTIVNSVALREIDVTDVPEGGEVLMDAAGKPTGVFLYAAKRMTQLAAQGSAIVADISTEEAIVRGLESAAQLGLTGIVNPGTNLDEIAAFRAVAKEGRLPIRADIMPRGVTPDELSDAGVTYGMREGWLTLAPIKLGYDRWVMHKTALLYDPYVGEPDNFGITRVSAEELQRRINAAFAAGWPVGIHATGDRGIDVVASAIETGYEEVGEPCGRCHLVHVYFPTKKAQDIAFRLDMAIAAQPPFIRTWGETVRAFVGDERAGRFKPLRTLLDRGLAVGGGADSPVAWQDPWVGIYAAATRRTEGGGVLGEEERISVEEALRCYTLGSAAVVGEEELRGSIEVGKLADLTIIDRDILAIDREEIPGTKVLWTLVDGEIAYAANG